jgi:hypothetical protein
MFVLRDEFSQQSCLRVGATQAHEKVVLVGEGVVLSQVSESKPGAPMFVLRDKFRRQILRMQRQSQDDSASGGTVAEILAGRIS